MNLHDEIDKKANFWLIKQNEGIKKEEQKEFDFWLENKNHKKAYDENKQLINECLSLDDNFIEELENEIFSEDKKISFFKRNKHLVASIILFCILVIGGYEIDKYFIPTFSQNFVSVNEKILNIQLPDKSIIDLDKKSQIRISYYQTKRVIELKGGNALFSVSKDKQKPFLVKTKDTLVEVLGTKFEIITFDDKTTINVLDGVVQVSHLDKYNKTFLAKLRKSESFTLNNQGAILNHGKIDTSEIAIWKKDIIKFNRTTLKDASSMFERYTNNKMIFGNDKLSELKISGKFLTLHYDSFLESIKLIYPIKVRKQGDVVKIQKKD
jgi:transmembrane sensor